MSNETKSNRGATIAVTAVLAVAAIGAYHGIVNYENYGEKLEKIEADMATLVENNNAMVAASTAATAAAEEALAAATKAAEDAAAATRTARQAAAAAPAGEGAAAPAGLFSEEQIARGETSYQSICAMCHGDAVADMFATYTGSANDLMNTFIGLGMPATNPGGLPAQEDIDIAAYIFNRGGLPTGAEVVAGSAEADQVVI